MPPEKIGKHNHVQLTAVINNKSTVKYTNERFNARRYDVNERLLMLEILHFFVLKKKFLHSKVWKMWIEKHHKYVKDRLQRNLQTLKTLLSVFLLIAKIYNWSLNFRIWILKPILSVHYFFPIYKPLFPSPEKKQQQE